jgi:hypothetical protein
MTKCFPRLGAAVLISALALAGCGKSPGDFAAADLQGVWAWYGAENCWNHGNTISFEPVAGGAGERIVVRLSGQTVLNVPTARSERTNTGEGAPLMVVRYALENRQFEEQYRIDDYNRIVVVQSMVDGQAQPSLPMLKDKPLVRCTPADIGPPVKTAAATDQPLPPAPTTPAAAPAQ